MKEKQTKFADEFTFNHDNSNETKRKVNVFKDRFKEETVETLEIHVGEMILEDDEFIVRSSMKANAS